jgi:hypothetical protein
MITRVRAHLSYGNVVATMSLFVALGGTSFAIAEIGSDDVRNNSLRSRDIRNNTLRSQDVHDRSLRARDLGRDSLGRTVVKESALGLVPRAADANRVGGASVQELRLTCPGDTLARAGGCVERAARPADGYLGAINVCDQIGRTLPTMAQLDAFLRATGGLPQPEWTSNVYRNVASGPDPFDELEAVLLGGGGDVSYDRVYLAVQHAFRCVALPSN